MLFALAAALPAHAAWSCQRGLRLTLTTFADQYLLPYNGYPAPPSQQCWSSCTTSYNGNYTVRLISGRGIKVYFGDHRCGQPPGEDWFSFGQNEYTDNFSYSHRWNYLAVYSSYFPMVRIWCNTGIGGSCQVEAEICQNVNNFVKGDTVPIANA